MDYHSLKVIVSNNFPTPAIKELLDELHLSTVYSKLDLKPKYHRIKMHGSDSPFLKARKTLRDFSEAIQTIQCSNHLSIVNEPHVFRPLWKIFILAF